MFANTNILLPAIMFTVIGIIIGVIVVLIFVDRSRVKSNGKSAVKAHAKDAVEMPELPASRFDNVANLFRERSSSQLYIQVDKKVYPAREHVPSKVLQELEITLEGFSNWLGKTAAPVAEPVRVEPAAPPIMPPPAATTRSETPTATTIVGQINEILQEILEESNNPDRKIALSQEPSLGVVVWADGVKYTGIDDVPDPEIKELIQLAVKKWERKNDLSRRYP